MRAFIGFGALAIMGIGPLIVWFLVQRARQKPDLQWKPTGYRYLHTGHDQALGQRGATRAAALVTRRLTMASERSMPLSGVTTVRGATNIVDIRPRRVAN